MNMLFESAQITDVNALRLAVFGDDTDYARYLRQIIKNRGASLDSQSYDDKAFIRLLNHLLINHILYDDEACRALNIPTLAVEKLQDFFGLKLKALVNYNRVILEVAFSDYLEAIALPKLEYKQEQHFHDLLRKKIRSQSKQLMTPFRMKPSFFIIGCQRCGTSSMFDYLTQHDQVIPPRAKELHFFSDPNKNKIALYFRQYPVQLVPRESMITGEATPEYIFFTTALQDIRKNFPDAKIIIMLRNPVDRAISQYKAQMPVRRAGLLDDWVYQEDEKIGALLQATRQNLNVLKQNPSVRYHSYLARGRYIEQVSTVFELFPKENILIVRSEDLFAQTASTVQQVFEFLGVSKTYDIKFHNYTDMKRQANDYAEYLDDAKSISSETRQFLEAYFKPYNEQLYDYLQRDFGW